MPFSWDDEKQTGTATATATAPKTGGGFSWDTDENKKQFDQQKIASDYQAAKENEALVANQGKPQGSAVGRFASGLYSGIKALNPFSGVTQDTQPKTAMDYASMISPLIPMGLAGAQQYQKARQAGAGGIESVASGVGGAVGLPVEDIRNRARQGDLAGVLGESIPLVGSAAAPAVARKIPAVRAALRERVLTPEGELTPKAAAAAKVGGAAVGGAAGEVVGHPWIGGAIGERMGPSLLKLAAGDQPKGIPKVVPGGEIKPPVVSPEPFKLEAPPEVKEEPVQQQLTFPPEQKGEPIARMGRQIEEAAGVPKLDPNAPLKEQLPQFGGKVTFRNPRLLRTPEVEPGRMQRPEGMTGETSKAGGIPEMIPEEVGRQMGAPPLEPNVPLREQLTPRPEAPPSRQMMLEQKYPDKAIRQMVHANGEEMVDAVGDDKELMQKVHDLSNSDVRQAMINSGEDMGQTSIGSRKATGNQMSRQDAFKKLLAKGLTPQKIVELATQQKPAEPKEEEE